MVIFGKQANTYQTFLLRFSYSYFFQHSNCLKPTFAKTQNGFHVKTGDIACLKNGFVTVGKIVRMDQMKKIAFRCLKDRERKPNQRQKSATPNSITEKSILDAGLKQKLQMNSNLQNFKDLEKQLQQVQQHQVQQQYPQQQKKETLLI